MTWSLEDAIDALLQGDMLPDDGADYLRRKLGRREHTAPRKALRAPVAARRSRR